MEKGKGKLVRLNDPFWDFVEKAEDKWLCTFCRHKYAVGTSISRIKWHLSGEKGRGTTTCAQVPDDVKEAAYMAIHGSRKVPKTIPSSSTAADGNNADRFPTAPFVQNNQVENPARDGGSLPMEIQSGEHGVAEWTTCFDADMEGGNELMSYLLGDQETGGNPRGTADLVGQVAGKDWPEIYSLTERNAEGTQQENINGEGVMLDGRVTGGTAFPTSKLVGEAFQESVDEIISCLETDAISTIGVYGMGGIGKTTLMMHVHNQLLRRPESVLWVTVSQDFSIYRLQNLIANAMKLDISNEVEEKRRAARLLHEMILKQKLVIILDDLWHQFSLEKVGIPVGLNGCKLIITTRSLDVCRWMGCQMKIHVNCLSVEEAWALFEEKLGNDMELPFDVKQIAESIAKECAGLPLGIITMAGSMRGVEDVCEWRNALEELKKSKVRHDDMEPEVFQVLKLSYNGLKDLALQKCFLYCALYPEDHEITRIELIGYLIDEGIIEEMDSRQQEFDKGQTMLNKLVNVCLLERGYNCVKLHDLIRDMALQIQGDGSGAMIKPGAQLMEFPDEGKWTEDLTRVSLMENHFMEIHSGHSPTCPSLSTLLLCRNKNLEHIGNLFFKKLAALKILDMSNISIRILPDAISDLVHLTTLLVYGCAKLRFMPSLAKLKRLKKLDVRHTGLEEVPQGLELLQNLKYLDLYGTQIKKLPIGLLPMLSRLQFFGFVWSPQTSIRIAEELECLRKLEALSCCFTDVFEFNEYLLGFQRQCNKSSLTDFDIRNQPVSSYQFIIGQIKLDIDDLVHGYPGRLENRYSKMLKLKNCCIGERGNFVELPDDIQEIWIQECNDARSLCGVSSRRYATKLKYFFVAHCSRVECLVSCLLPCIFDGLETLNLLYLKNLHALIGREESTPRTLPSSGFFSCLKIITISFCKSLKRLFPGRLLENLQNLEEITVGYCELLEEIIETEEESMSSTFHNRIGFSLPKLRLLCLIELPKLKSICNVSLKCSSLGEIQVAYCLKLWRVPVMLPLPALKRIKAYPKEWWESVEWGNPVDRTALESKCLIIRQIEILVVKNTNLFLNTHILV